MDSFIESPETPFESTPLRMRINNGITMTGVPRTSFRMADRNPHFVANHK